MELIEKIKKYQKFFDKLEKKKSGSGPNKKNAFKSFMSVPGARGLFNSKGEVDLTVEDIK